MVRWHTSIVTRTTRLLHHGPPAVAAMVASRRRTAPSAAGNSVLAGNAAAWASSRKLFSWLRGPLEPPEAPIGLGSDPYAWLQHGDERKIKKYLEAENRYCRSVLKQAKQVERMYFSAMTERLGAQELGDPEKIEGWYYYMRTREGSAFPVYCRKKELESGREEVLLDQDDMASRLPYLMVPQCKISPCHTMLAYTADTTGSERYDGFVKDLASGDIICQVEDVTTVEWATDGKTILYTQPDHHRRPCRLWRRSLQEVDDDELILEVCS
jgi:oligopeptidase B